MEKTLRNIVSNGIHAMRFSTGKLELSAHRPPEAPKYSPLETNKTKLYSTCHYLLKASQHSLRNILEIVKTKLMDYSKVMPI